MVRDPYYMSPYAYSGRQWVGYDDVESITLKTRLINKLGLAGGMIWSLETDDFLGSCYGIKYPLLNTIKKELALNNRDLPHPPLTEPVKTLISTSTTTSTTTTTTTTKKPIISTSISTLNWPFKYSTRSTTSSTTSPLSDSASKTASSSQFTTETSPSTTNKVTESNSSISNTPILITSSTTSPSSPSTESTKVEEKMVCKSVGMFRNPQDCKKFYRCVELGFEGRFSMYEYECPQDTVFDSATQICLWPNSVPECRNYYSQNEILGGNGRWNPIIKRK